MPKAYLIAQATVSDPEAYGRYVAGTKAAFDKYGAKPLARGGRTEVMEGHGRPRVVVLEFADLDMARAYYNSAEYQAARAERIGAAEFDSIIVEDRAPGRGVIERLASMTSGQVRVSLSLPRLAC